MAQIREATEGEAACVAHLKAVLKPDDLDPADTNFLNDTTLLRFARARDGDCARATKMLRECLRWRQTYQPHRITAADVADILQLGTVFMAGTCVHHRPVMYMTPGVKNPFPAETRVKLMVFLLEDTMRQGHASLTWLVDFSRMGERGADEHSAATRKDTIHILQNYYPERLGALYMVNTPWYFRAAATLLWPFIDKRTREKIHVSVKLKHLTDYIVKEELIEALGGTMKLPWEHVAEATPIPVPT